MPDDVRDLVQRCLGGDQAAMASLVERFQGDVFGLCYRMLGQRQDAEDMAQESFVRALRSLARFDTDREFKPWLLAIAGNRCRSLLSVRMQRARPTDEVDQVPDHAPDPQSAANLAEEIDRALNTLRPEYRQSFVLFHHQQLSYAEIAEVLACPVGTVKTWVHRARHELADELRRRGVVEVSSGQESPHAMRKL